MGGFECADHINRAGNRVNLLQLTEHDIRAREDYALLAKLSILTVREGICWSAVESSPYVFDFTEVETRMTAARRQGIQVIWDLCHFGYPDDLMPTHPRFVDRFVALCRAFARFHREQTDEQLLVVPINEISFLSWHSGDMRGTVPFATNSGWDIKWHLCRAAIAGIQALLDTDPACRILTIEPLIRVHPSEHSSPAHLANLNNNQFQAMDIIAGRMCPELGGQERYLDILGFNCYYDGQWTDGQGHLPWPESEARRIPLSDLLQGAYERYRRPFFLSETGHFGDGRARWLHETMYECTKLVRQNRNFLGLCIYPVIDRPDWDDLTVFHNSGLFDLDSYNNRIPHRAAIEAIHQMQEVVTNSVLQPASSYWPTEGPEN